MIGAGFTGVEVATEMPPGCSRRAGRPGRVVLVGPEPWSGRNWAPDRGRSYSSALAELGVEVRLGRRLTTV